MDRRTDASVKPVQSLKRIHFATNRVMDFFSEKELISQTAHQVEEWPLVAIKELVDNALDACEEAGVQPEISVLVGPYVMSIADNGPGIPESVISSVLDFEKRVSSREAYVSPSRGAQGNALKTLVSMPFVLSGGGSIVIESRGVRHEITVSIDELQQQPKIRHLKTPSNVNLGTVVHLEWPNSPWSNRTGDESQTLQIGGGNTNSSKGYRPSAWHILRDAECKIRTILLDYSCLNPHLRLTLKFLDEIDEFCPTLPDWKKWKPSTPTDPHWYRVEDLKRLIAANISQKDRLVREFVSEFRGLTGSAKQKQVLDRSGMARRMLSAFIKQDRAICDKEVQRLLAAMQSAVSPVKPASLGIIGEEHMITRCYELYADPDSIQYKKSMGVEDGVPWVLEVCFAMLPQSEDRKIITGVNWSPAIKNPFRSVGVDGGSFDALLESLHVNECSPVLILVHLTSAKVRYTDRGKSSVILMDSIDENSIKNKLIELVSSVTKKWTKMRLQEIRNNERCSRRQETFVKSLNFTQVADDIVPVAYEVVSGGGKYTVDQRQMFYQCREEFRKKTGKSIKDGYFTNVILRRFMNRNPHWKITASPRGTLSIPNTIDDTRIPCGTIAIDGYLKKSAGLVLTTESLKDTTIDDRWPSISPGHRYQAVLYIEKEGFEPQLREARIAENYDLAIISCKGQSVVAARKLVDEVCGVDGGVPLFTVHDFDEAGFEIARCLTTESVKSDKDRIAYRFKNKIKVVDFGLRLADAMKYDLKPEEYNPRKLALPNASKEEVAFLHSGRRIELNAFTAPQFIEWITSKLDEHIPNRLIPDEETINAAFQRAVTVHFVNSEIEALVQKSIDHAEKIEVPSDLLAKIGEIVATKGIPWDLAVSEVSKASIA